MRILFLLWALPLSADTILFTTPGGSTMDGQPVAVQALFQTSLDHITITLENMVGETRSVAQAVSSLNFAIGTGDPALVRLIMSTAERVSVENDGTVADLGIGPTGWLLDTSAGNESLRLCVLCAPAGPSQTLLSAPPPGNVYLDANRSIAANRPHNPFLAGAAVFSVWAPGVTASTTIEDVRMGFGSAEGKYVDAVRTPDGVSVPEPPALVLIVGGITLLLLYAVLFGGRVRYDKTHRSSTAV